MLLRSCSLILILLASLLTSGCVVLVPLFEEDPFAVRMDEPPAPVINAVAQRRQAVSVLRAPKPSKSTLLIRSLKNGDPAARTNAATSLGYLAPPSNAAVQALIAALSDESKNVRRAAVKALGRLRIQRAVPYLARALRDRDKYVAHSAAGALRKIGTAEARAALQKG